MIALACPDASYVCGFRTWLQLGYQVRKGKKAIWILAPTSITNRTRYETQTEDGEDERRILFRALPVFDRSQVAEILGGIPTPLQPSCEPLTGDSHGHLIDPLTTFASSLGYSVSFEKIPGATGGWCDQHRKLVVVDASQPVNAQVRVLVPWRSSLIPPGRMRWDLSRRRSRVSPSRRPGRRRHSWRVHAVSERARGRALLAV